MSAKPIRIRVIAGPTAVGKTAYSLCLTEGREVEIVSADSRQIYRQLTIGTAKPESDALARVRHHFIDELDLSEHYSAGLFALQANERIETIIAKGCEPVVVGGSTLYLHALIHGLSPMAPRDSEIRKELQSQLDADGSERLYDELKQIDHRSAATMDSTKTSRIIRALEVYRITGVPISEFHRYIEPPPYQYDVSVLSMERSQLYERINDRVDRMLQSGLLGEVRKIMESGFDRQIPALRTIGYQEVLAHFYGETSEAEMVRLIKRNTRRYAKRQLTWFRRYPEYRWVDVSKS